jgi:MFS family permease
MSKGPSVELTSFGLPSGSAGRAPSALGPSDEDISSPANAALEAPLADEPTTVLPKGRAIIVISQLVGLQLFSSFCNGIIVVGLPGIAKTLNLEASLLLWPTSVFYLTAGSCLMLAGSITDVLGTRPMVLTANILLAASSLACGLAQNGGELIAFRGLQGISNAIAVPASISVEYGQSRNLGFSCLGFSGPLGFLLGLVLGGVFVDGIGWRPAFYLVAAASFALAVVGFWVLPKVPRPTHGRSIGNQLTLGIDWIGTLISTTGLVTFSYALA